MWGVAKTMAESTQNDAVVVLPPDTPLTEDERAKALRLGQYECGGENRVGGNVCRAGEAR